MIRFIKDNPTLALGLGLPMLLVLLFSISADIPNLIASAPKYDVVFATNYYTGYYDGVQISVINGKINARYIAPCNECQQPALYRYNASNGTLKRIELNLPPQAAPGLRSLPGIDQVPKRAVSFTIPELEGLRLNDSNPSPDGYEFAYGDNYTSAGLLPELFFASRSSYDNGPLLKKGTYRITLPLPKNYYNSSNVRFIGWVVTP